MSQVSYKITQICCVGFPQISVPQLAAVRESSMESSQIRRRIIAGYSQNLRMYPQNVLQKGCRRTFQGDCRDSEDSQRRFRWLDSRGLLKLVLKTPEDDSAGARKTTPQSPKDNSAGSPQTICKFPHTLSRKAATDYRGSRRISVSNL